MLRFLSSARPGFSLRRAATPVAAAALVVIVGGWASSVRGPGPDATPRAIGSLGPGFIDPASPPPPEGTIHPRPGSWDAVHPPPGYHVVLLTSGDDGPVTTLRAAVREWAVTERVRLETVTVTPALAVDGIVEAMERRPDLVISAGNSLVDALAVVTASHLDRLFLVFGAQLPEPTINVTAAVWRGASSRGREAPDTAASFHPDAFTPARAGAALRAGVASVLNGFTGIVVSLD